MCDTNSATNMRTFGGDAYSCDVGDKNAWDVYESRTKFACATTVGDGETTERENDTFNDAATCC